MGTNSLCVDQAIFELYKTFCVLYGCSTTNTIDCIAGKFGGGKVSQIYSFRAFGERKFGELIDQPKGH